jgi:hypothetical protein
MEEASAPTWICYADSNISTLERLSIESQCLLQAIEAAEFRIAESLWLLLDLVFDDSHVDAFTVSEEVLHISNRSLEGQVAQVHRVRWLIRQWKFLTNGVTCAEKTRVKG